MKIKSLLLMVVISFFSQAGLANTITSNDASCFAGTARIFSVTATSVSSCILAGAGNINGNNQADAGLITAGWIFVDTSANTTDGAHDGWLTGSPSLIAGLSGTFTINAAAYTTYDQIAIGFKSGFAQISPEFAIFELADNTFTGSWSISGQQALSHAILYGRGTPSTCTGNCGGGGNEIPEPLTLSLFGLGLVGIYATRRRVRI